MRSVLILLFIASVVYAAKIKDERILLQDGLVYQILSKSEKGALTTDAHSTEKVPVFTRAYNETSGQKWRLKKATTGSSFRLIPSNNENAALDMDKKTLNIWGKNKASGNRMYWNLKNMGEGVVQIQNWKQNNLCLTAMGLDKEVAVAVCENGVDQQWQFIPL